MKLTYSAIYLPVILLLIIPLVLSLFLNNIPNDFQPSLTTTQHIYHGMDITQEFVSEDNNLVGIGMSIKNPYYRNRKDLIFSLFSAGKQELRRVVLNGKTIKDGEFVEIIFEPIKDAKNKDFIFKMSAPNVASQESLEVFLTNNSPSWSKNFFVKSDIQDTDVSFVTLHGFNNRFALYFEIIKGWIGRFFADTIFFAFYWISVLILMIYLVVKSFFR
ncbi:hypothetical protein HYW42_02705 [Candidatus Daviesbacteria bacterium]|nr:hypothetical protein [Candidatus Daviesbacteria bacterium]